MMVNKYANHVVNSGTPQSEKARENQVKNDAGGYVFEVDIWTRLNRFLIMGCENGSYYTSESKMVSLNYECIVECLKSDAKRTVDTILSISDSGRAVKNAPAVFALAVCSVFGDQKTKEYANKVMPKVARFSTDMFSWVDAINTLKEGKKGKGLLRAIGRWYTEKDADFLAYQVCKYPSRSIGGEKWSHADLLKLARISPSKGDKPSRNGRALTIPSSSHAKVFQYAVRGITSDEDREISQNVEMETGKTQKAFGLSEEELESLKNSSLKYIWAHEKCKKANSVKEVVKIIKDHGVTRESVLPHFRNEIEVQKALLPGMPMTALIRNLGGMTSSGLLKPLSDETSLVIDNITNEETLKKARIHPMSVMLALKTYSKGSGMRTSWNPVPAIRDALEDAFYKCFNYVEPTGKKFLFGVDVSGSMSWTFDSNHLMSACEAAAVVAMTCARTEKNYHIMAFSDAFKDLNITSKDSLNTVIRKTSNHNFGRTDCALPMKYAIKNELDVDVFVILTDSDTWVGDIHPFEALKKYRKKFNKNAKLAVLAFSASKFSIADPSDAGMIDIAGLDSSVPVILSEFASNRL
jgi:60 kDa SS-A/Ro ribonucleoprotein